MVASPKRIPSREEIAELGESDERVGCSLRLYRAGHISYEDALRIALIAISAGRIPEAVADMSEPPTVDAGLRAWTAGLFIGFATGVLAAAMLLGG